MDIVLDVDLHQYDGTMTVTYFNESPDVINKMYWHLFFNAFQPESMMDARSRTISDPDRRVGSRIAELPEEEWGWINIKEVSMDGVQIDFQEDGTILEVLLPQGINPQDSATFMLRWTAQVPRQIRRSGWMNAEGVEFSMTQWFPKICEYDHHGWHSNPYIGREFHGVWGDFDVSILLPIDYHMAATGELVSETPVELSDGSAGMSHRYVASNVIDFAWAADPDFVEESVMVDDVAIHLVHQSNPEIDENWTRLSEFAAKAMAFINQDIGQYPYPSYSIVQGGDGGMEYPMLTLITGERTLKSLVGVAVHEMAHSWFQATVATNESLHEWMDEGFTSWAESRCMAELFVDPMKPEENPHQWAYSSYINHHLSGNEEPLSTHADHYKTNRAYGVAAYSKGEVLVEQLGAIVGPSVRDDAMRRYYAEWQFKHPGPTDFKRVVERESGIELDWYFQYMMNTTEAIDYAAESVQNNGDVVQIELSRRGGMPMPQDLELTWEDGTTTRAHIPLVMMRGHRLPLDNELILEDWPWVNPTYHVELPSKGMLLSVTLDPTNLQADVHRENNSLILEVDKTEGQKSKRKRSKNQQEATQTH